MADINPGFEQFRKYRQAVGEPCSRFGSTHWHGVEERSNVLGLSRSRSY
jgi:hypothetical protein